MNAIIIIIKLGNLQCSILSNNYRRVIRLRSVRQIENQPYHDLRVIYGRSLKSCASFCTIFNYKLFSNNIPYAKR